MVNFSNAPSTNLNKKSQEKRYIRFCDWLELEPFPVSEWRLVLFATYLSLTMVSVESIKAYCGLVAELHELQGFEPVRRGRLFAKAILGIWRLLQHEVQRAQPITTELLKQMVELVDINDEKQLATWVAILFRFYLFLCKSNLVPVTRQHDQFHQISRCDVKYLQNVLVAEIKWSKTNQFGQNKLKVPVFCKGNSTICPVEWLLFMVKRIPAHPHHNLFSFTGDNGEILPVTYHDLTMQMRDWLTQMDVQDVHRYSSHLLR